MNGRMDGEMGRKVDRRIGGRRNDDRERPAAAGRDVMVEPKRARKSDYTD
jgi:hypothetical protein